ncbi:septation protein SepH [Leucobacter sp. USHLN153]|uniref:septation protein SepH n=1 Tax=Leucobacter sp. USHLN153 TaxID=3081268 RepID=UPI003018EA70
MDELRFVRRDDRSLIVANDSGEEFRFVVDDAALSELRHLSRRETSAAPVRPREIQALIRAGKTRAEVVALTGLADADVERYEEPVLAERRYILERAHAVPVRTGTHGDTDQRFGEVIADRLVSLGSDTSEWSAWRDPERGWMVSLEFISHDVAHEAVWSFEHRKGVLSPVNSDAVNLSKQGDVGDRLIPKLRAVDSREHSEQSERFDSGAFDSEELAGASAGVEEAKRQSADADGALEAAGEDAASGDVNAEYQRRKEIDQRAISSDSAEPVDFSQTADLLDALRKRRGERNQGKQEAGLRPQPLDLDALGDSGEGSDRADQGSAPTSSRDTSPQGPQRIAPEAPVRDSSASPRSIWGNAGVSSSLPASPTRPAAPRPVAGTQNSDASTAEDSEAPREESSGSDAERPARKGRASIPSWDAILFGTRSDEDPAK